MDYISEKAASEKWGISERRIQKLCEENHIDRTGLRNLEHFREPSAGSFTWAKLSKIRKGTATLDGEEFSCPK